jgi:uncharacterized protein (TIGR02001 family)
MARRREVGTLGLGILSAALIAGLALPADADDKKLTLSATTAFTTDYIFRGVSNSNQNPAAQPEFDLYYGIFYAGIWGSNVDFGGTPFGDDVASIEIDYYAGITPKWKGITFNIAGLYYTYPGAFDPAGEFDYFELKTGLSYTFAEKLTLSVTNYWSPEYFGEVGESDAIEGSAAYAFGGKLFNFFSPTISGGVGYWGFDELTTDYTYWNVGLTLGFMDHWSVDARYYDTNLSDTECLAFTAVSTELCGGRVVGTVKAVF